MAQTMIAQKMLEVDANLQKVGTDMITMFKVATKKTKTAENWLNQGFSQDDNDVKKKQTSSSESFS